ncbi:MAG: polyribonucleotide nucleotidyltransferase [Bacteroidales bacterium]|jgi:polyribonucleotide nucleotidyltransferase|nr:polyribonucleotide nucleotidyltransferase [Bacteroidales bacterium]MDD3152496.1 polyribonucleotide nucleotidyltransferase [Bacteroidales bacterium]MDD4634119.1 polyribonucleotide nucleotidyltransferase [Bacteroidales bacterium]
MLETQRTTAFQLPDGRQVTIETGKLAKQANGSVVVRCDNTMLLATVVAKEEAAENADFMPLSVDYKEKYYAVGRFPGGFFKREAKSSDYEILISRLIDRALRPLFPDDFHAEVQVQVTLISGDKAVPPDAFAALAASAALSVSDIPFNGPISEVRVAQINGEFVINPNFEVLKDATLELVVAADMKNIMMVEGECLEVSEDTMIAALKAAHEAIKVQCQAQIDLAAQVEKAQNKYDYCHETNDEELRQQVTDFCYPKCYEVAKSHTANKKLRTQMFEDVKTAFIETIEEEEREAKQFMVERYFYDAEKSAVRNYILDTHKRIDGRDLDEIRPIWCEVDCLPSAHGSAIFTRGETQSLSAVTLGTKLDEQIIDGAVVESKERFILHYNFPSFATGEVKATRGVSRREVGHGNLALRALKNMIPSDMEVNPYSIRIVSDILESNGSSSMATVCAGTLALMDAGVQIKKPVSGIAMGLITDNSRYVVLSDILGDEDHLGDMDFKVTGTRDGITACQMDIKVDGLPYEILAKALEQAKKGRMHILDIITDTIPEPRATYKDHVPRIETMIIDKEFIGAVIGPGGKIIQEIQNDTKSTIVIEEEDNKGIIQIFAPDYESITAAKNRIRLITAKPEVGEIYSGKVKSITDFGAFVEFLPGKDGLLHISEICWERLDDVKSVLNIGDTVDVKLIEIDPKTGKYRLSRKVLLPKPEGYVAPNKEHGNNENRRQGQGQDNRQDNRRFKPRSNNSNPQK